jgi:hypothetical protein
MLGRPLNNAFSSPWLLDQEIKQVVLEAHQAWLAVDDRGHLCSFGPLPLGKGWVLASGTAETPVC